MDPMQEMVMMYRAMNPEPGCKDCGSPHADWKDGRCDACALEDQIHDLEHRRCTGEFCWHTDNPYTGERA